MEEEGLMDSENNMDGWVTSVELVVQINEIRKMISEKQVKDMLHVGMIRFLQNLENYL